MMRPIVTLLVATSCAVLAAQGPQAPPLGPNAVKTGTGLRYEDLRLGKGATADKHSRVRILYTGYLRSGAIFDQRTDRNRPLDMQLGEGRLIKGMEEGIVGMRVGGKRRVVIPPALGYGAKGVAPRIPPNAELTFDIELVGVAKPKP